MLLLGSNGIVASQIALPSTQIGVSLATLAYYYGPMIVMVLSPLLFRERLTLAKLMGFAVVLAGFFLINHQAYQDGKSALGLLFGGLSAVLYALMVILNKNAKSIQGLENAMLSCWSVF